MAPGTRNPGSLDSGGDGGGGRHADPGDDAIDICRSLIRIDTTNPGRPERPATELVAAILSDLALDPVLFEPEPGRTSVVARVAGDDPAAGALLVHGHLDVVPADPAGWRYPPFSGEVAEGCVWGRGAVDMKGPVAMVLAALRARLRQGRRPRTDVVVAFVADEERGSRLGAQYVVDERPDLFEGCRVAIGEVGGFSSALGGERAYLVQTAERGVAWTELGAAGVPGHGSLLAEDSALVNLAGVVAGLGGRPLAVRASETNIAFAAGVLRRLGADPAELERLGPDELLERLDEALAGFGPIRRMLAASVRNTANPTAFEAGVSPNVVPATAKAVVDGRFVPGHEAALDSELAEVCGEQVVRRPILRLPGIESPPAGPFVGAMARALARVDPDASVLPFTWPGFTDAKQFARLGIDCYGFMPLDLPAGFDFSSVFHAPDERVPEGALRFGVRVLDALFDEDWTPNEESAGQGPK